ncbi:MAG TPA: nucleotidyl transferase AbiEii/AbiGii toxin family protein [Polyangiaceae bacterium]|jgi:fructose-1,6-bisphosphatase/sedoheptulose 1,7-bisphosphatase-like protein
MTETTIEAALALAVASLRNRKRRFALVGGLAVSVRAEVRFTRDVDLAVAVNDDADAESLVRDLRADGFTVAATVEHDVQERLSTVRLVIRGVKVDLLFASSGIEPEIVSGAADVEVLNVGPIPVALAEDLLAMKVLSMTERRLQDRIDAQKLLRVREDLDVDRVRRQLELVTKRGFNRNQDLSAKLDALLRERDART